MTTGDATPTAGEKTKSSVSVDCHQDVPFPVALVGIAMRLPGGVANADEFWDMLINKRDGHGRVPESRYSSDAFKGVTGPNQSLPDGYFLQDDITRFDRSFFSLSARAVERLDPQQRLLMEVIWECLENSGQTKWHGKDVGCFVGVFGENWAELTNKDNQQVDKYYSVNTGDYAIANRVSWEYDFRGPSITYRTACSSSLVALHDACQALYTGECSSAIGSVASPSDVCKTFDVAADGYGRGEAINVVYIKPLRTALQDRDPIRAVIRSTAINSDGRTPNIAMPSPEAQEKLSRRAYRKACIDNISETGFFECHSTGTKMGDAIETSVVAKVFPGEGVYIGSVKPNVGHSGGASGLTSVIKAVLALEKRNIPPNTRLSNPNPRIPLDKGLEIPEQPTPWPKERCERVSVNSFGIGGSNAHVCTTRDFMERPEMLPQAEGARVIVASSKTKQALDLEIESIKAYITQRCPSAADLSYTLGMRREHMVHRAFAILDNDGSISRFERSEATAPGVCFVSTGQGAQWPGVAKELMSTSSCFINSIRTMDASLQRLRDPPTWSLEGKYQTASLKEIRKEESSSRIQDAELAQPLCTAIQIGLVDLFRELGVRPARVVGHSSGEVAAAYAAGAIDAETAIVVSYCRGQVLRAPAVGAFGAMAVVGLNADEARALLPDGVHVACENSPQNVTLSGDRDKVLQVLEKIQTEKSDVFCRQLRVSVAYHSHHMEAPGQTYEELLTPALSHGSSMIPLFSTTTGKVIREPAALDAAYWRRNLQCPVLFNQAVQELAKSTDEHMAFVEIGPHSTLSGPLQQIIQSEGLKKPYLYIPTLVRHSPQWQCLLTAVGRLHVNGVPVQLSTINRNTGTVLTDLPSYPWSHERRLWHETRIAQQWRKPREPHHELLGFRTLESSDMEPSWRKALKLKHLVTAFRSAKLNLLADSVWYDFTISSYQDAFWTRHCIGQIRAGSDRHVDQPKLEQYSRQKPSSQWYKAVAKKGLKFGPSFQRLQDITTSPTSQRAAARIDEEDDSRGYALHPTIIDQARQLCLLGLIHGLDRNLSRHCVPTAVDYLYVSPQRGTLFADACADESGASISGRACMVTEEKVVLSMEGAWLVLQAGRTNTEPQPTSAVCNDSLCASCDREKTWSNRLVDQVQQQLPHFAALTTFLQNVSTQTLIMEGGSKSMSLLDNNTVLDCVYEYVSTHSGWGKFLSMMSHTNPLMRVLQIEPGNGFATMAALRSLTTTDGIPMYTKFTITNKELTRFSAMKESFRESRGLNHSSLDIAKDPLEQGFEPGTYDLVIIEGNRYIDQDLSSIAKNIATLLAPGGRLLYHKLCSAVTLLTYTMGMFSDWWDWYEDGDEQFMPEAQWHAALRSAGFSTSTIDITERLQPDDLHLRLAVQPRSDVKEKREITLLSLSEVSSWGYDLARRLEREKYHVRWCSLNEFKATGTDVISILDLEQPSLDSLSVGDFQRLQSLVEQAGDCHILWITQPSQTTCHDPRYGLLQGFARTMRHERIQNFVTFEVDRFDGTAARSVVNILDKLRAQDTCVEQEPDYEYVLQDGKVLVGRVHWTRARRPELPASSADSITKALTIGSYGLLNSLEWVETDLGQLNGSDVEVEMSYVGLNLRDMLVCLGLVGDKSEFGLEGTVGNRVIVAGDGLLCTRKIVPEARCFPLFEGLTLEDGAGITSIYGTVLYALLTVGNLRKGQSILIHSACGGVGLAAVQVCQMVGAEIYATVGNEQKVQYLVDTFTIPRSHIFDSRSSSFYQGLMEVTDQKGVDVVLNSLSGELLHLSWQCVASFGKMIELGKRDIYGHGQLDMGHFTGNKSFIAVDAKHLLEERPDYFREAIEQCKGYFIQGKIKPVRPTTVFDAASVGEAFSLMQSGQHMGKLLVRMPDSPSDLPVSARNCPVPLRSDAYFLLIGGLGGLGRAVATWMVERGARKFVFLSRSAGLNSRDGGFIRELTDQGCDVETVAGSVENMQDVRRAVSACQGRIKGVIQMSMVLKDQLFSNMTHEEWLSVLGPKVQGTWNVHNALNGAKLQFFVALSSIAGVCGNPGQAHYAAANSFLDAFVKYRRGLGLPACSIDIGAMEGIGYAQDHLSHGIETARRKGIQTVGEVELLQALELAIQSDSLRGASQITIGLGTTRPLSTPGTVSPWVRDARYALWENTVPSDTAKTDIEDNELHNLIKSVEKDPAVLTDPKTKRHIALINGKEIGSLMTNIDGMNEEQILSIVIESLVMVEVRNFLRRHLHLELGLTDISKAETVGGLCTATINALRLKFSGSKQDQEDMASTRPIPGPIPEWFAESEGHVFVTGATGFIGAFFLSMLLSKPEAKTVTCLVRAADKSQAGHRLSETFRKFGLPLHSSHKLDVIPGDLTQDRLGLAQDAYDHLAQHVSGVFHIGAVVAFSMHYDYHRPANVMGLLNVIEFANTTRLKPVHHFSSISSYGPMSGLNWRQFVPENEIPTVTVKNIEPHMGYMLSKLASECIAWDAIANGFPISIYRPGLVMGHSITGVSNQDDVIYLLMSTCLSIGAFPTPPNQKSFFVPVDFVCSAALQISLSNENLGQAFNLIHPNVEETHRSTGHVQDYERAFATPGSSL
ncbi:hypothetical protein BDV25DRAFT_126571 [Aspergillus avenaceus]|uniref:Polyketide synthase n=1 Tax=Aspergillus avenaceus TaxID=36643 RepID=A0A5N6U6R9_ASPAV|nr:hypothetical protein BDV25DRAFT_126571 [Aspergillus avenaceus]